MKKRRIALKIFLAVFCAVLLTAGALTALYFYYRAPHESKWLVPGDDAIADVPFEETIASLSVMDNTWQSAVAQSKVYEMVREHFDSPLPAGKTAKKALVIGYDGCRADTLRLLETSEHSGVNLLLNGGGHAVFCYAGGTNYPHALRQVTNTAPGWCTMLTGVFADEHRVTGNNMVKPVEPKSLLLTLPESGKVNKTAFYTTWTGFSAESNATYLLEKEYAAKQHVKAKYVCGFVDVLTRLNALRDLKKKNCSDFIFTIFDYADHAGHNTGFSLQNSEYVSAFRNADGACADLIAAVQSRKTYDSEDWLIIITTDHGGKKQLHGGPSIEERIIFIVSNQEISF